MYSKYYVIELSTTTVTMDFGEFGVKKKEFSSPLCGKDPKEIEEFVKSRMAIIDGEGRGSSHSPILLIQHHSVLHEAHDYVRSLREFVVLDDGKMLPKSAIKSIAMVTVTGVERGWVKFDDDGNVVKISLPVTVEVVTYPEQKPQKKKPMVDSGDPKIDEAVMAFIDGEAKA
jgi:hypothetical protein